MVKEETVKDKTDKLKIGEQDKQQLLKEAKTKEEYPNSIDWNEYKDGDTVIGKIYLDDKKTIDFPDGSRDVIPILTENGNKSLWVTKILEKLFEEMKIKHEDTICILYKGKVKGKQFRYHNFGLSVL